MFLRPLFTKKTLKKTLANTVARFRTDQRGGVAVTFALSSIAVIGAAGVAIDFSNAAKSYDRVQNVADLASLAAAQSQSDDDAELVEIANAVFTRHFGENSGVDVTRVAKAGDVVTVDAASTVPTTLVRVFGVDEMDVSVTASSEFSANALDMALVLDTTGSMRGDKLASLKRAAGELVDTIAELDDDSVRLSVVPFTNHVNIGTNNRNRPWLEVPADDTESQWQRVEGTATNCRQDSGTYNDDGVDVPWSGEVCDYEWEETEVDVTWEGCVGSRNEPLDERASANGGRIPGILGKKCGKEIAPLSSNMNAVSAAIDGLQVQGNRTYTPAGLLWGWRMLDADAPFPNASASGGNDRVMVLMSDGDNTTSKTGDLHEGDISTAGRADDKTKALCSAAKDGGVTIYTIAFQIDDMSTRNLLRDCATDPSMNFDAASEIELTAAFRRIADSVKQLRVTS